MHGNLIRPNSIIRLAALALLALSFVQPPVRAHPTAIHPGEAQDSHIDLYRNVWLNPGLARGQTLRYTWANLNDPDPQQQEFQPLRIQVKLFAADGIVIAQAEAAAVGAGQFQSFDFNRDQINLPGEPATGRLQTRLEVTVSGVHRNTDITLKRGVIETFAEAAEIIDTLTGRTTVSFNGGMNAIILNDSSGNENLNPQTFQIISAGKDNLIGIGPGQTLRVSALNPFAPSAPGEDGRKFKMLFAVTILLADGRVVAQSDEITLDPGQFHSFNFKRADLPLAGEPGTGRLQARVLWKKLQLKSEFPSLVELLDDSTGQTALLLPIVQQLRCETQPNGEQKCRIVAVPVH